MGNEGRMNDRETHPKYTRLTSSPPNLEPPFPMRAPSANPPLFFAISARVSSYMCVRDAHSKTTENEGSRSRGIAMRGGEEGEGRRTMSPWRKARPSMYANLPREGGRSACLWQTRRIWRVLSYRYLDEGKANARGDVACAECEDAIAGKTDNEDDEDDEEDG